MRRRVVSLVLLVAAGAAVAAYAVNAGVIAGRADCPGKIVCPVTGERVCADRCALGAEGAPGSSLPPCCEGGK